MEIAVRTYRAAAPLIERSAGIALSIGIAILINGLFKTMLPKLEELSDQLKQDSLFADSIERNFKSYGELIENLKHCKQAEEPMENRRCVELYFSVKKHIEETENLKTIDAQLQALNDDFIKLIEHLQKKPKKPAAIAHAVNSTRFQWTNA